MSFSSFLKFLKLPARLVLALGAAVLVVQTTACGGSEDTDGASQTDTDDEEAEVATPSVIAVSPTTWAAGDTIKLIGTNFIGSDSGKAVARFVGTFTSENGEAEEVDMEIEPTVSASTKAEFTFEADVAPKGFGTSVGTFTGKITVTNVSDRGAQAKSNALSTKVSVGPSIVVWSMAPQYQSCANKVITDTLSGHLIEIELEVTGLGAGSSYAPIELTAAYVNATDAAVVIEDSITDGTTAYLTIDPGSLTDTDNPEAWNDARTSYDIGVSITAIDGNGQSLSRRVVFTVHQEYEVYYDGNVRISEVLEPQAVTGCLPGGQTGTSFNYSEGTSESRTRGYSLSANVGVSVGILSLGFGFGVSSSVSSGTSTGLGISHSVFPSWYGAFFRQTSKLLRTGTIYSWDACGGRDDVGDAYVTDWTWAPGFNQKKETCPPLPEPLLSEAGTVEVSQ